MLPYDRALRRAERRMRRDMVLHKLWTLNDPAAVYAGLLAYARNRQWKDGFAYYGFIEIYGVKPRRQDQNVKPQSHPLTDEWAAIRPKRSAKRRRAA